MNNKKPMSALDYLIATPLPELQKRKDKIKLRMVEAGKIINPVRRAACLERIKTDAVQLDKAIKAKTARLPDQMQPVNNKLVEEYGRDLADSLVKFARKHIADRVQPEKQSTAT